MFKFVVVFAACLACVAAKPGVFHPTALAAGPAGVAYANAPLYAAGGSSQVDIRHNYDGTLSSYTTSPFGYAGPYSSRYVAGAPATYAAAPAVYASAPVPAAFAGSIPAAYATGPAALAPAAKYVSPTGIATPFAAAPSPYIASYGSPYASPYAAPYSTYANAAYAPAHFATPFAAPAKFVV